jgi:Fuc2NAc and GlcNAc transferase
VNISLYIAAVAVAASAAFVLTGLVLRRAPLDLPSDRSSHSVPTPRGGGVAIVVVSILGVFWAGSAQSLDHRLVLALAGGGALVALVGWWDDRRGVAPRVRIVAHLAAASVGLWLIGGFPVLAVGGIQLQLGVAGDVLALAGIVWATNLFNFMDGIDGIAGVEALMVGLGGGLMMTLHGLPGASLAPLIIGAASLGFLGWNWAPARIFMGDVGSGFLGYCFAILAIWSDQHGGPLVMSWAALAMVFILDATVTVIRRSLRREQLTEAHRSHAYQRLVQSGWSHREVALAVLVINLVLIGVALLPPMAALIVSVSICSTSYLIVEKARPM